MIIKEPISSYIAYKIGYAIWITCEYLHIDLSRLAPYILGMMIGSKGKRIK